MLIKPEAYGKEEIPRDENGFPKTNLPQTTKNRDEYYAAWIHAAYTAASGYWGGLGWGNYIGRSNYGRSCDGYRSEIFRLRQMMLGAQSEQPYIDRFSLQTGETSRFGAGGSPDFLLEADPRILKIAPQLASKVKARMFRYPTVPSVSAGDPESTTAKQSMYMMDLFKSRPQNRMWAAAQSAAMGMQAPTDRRTEDEVQMDYEEGEYKVELEIAYEALLQRSLEMTRYDDEARRRAGEQGMLPGGIGCVAIKLMPDGRVTAESVIPENCLFPWRDQFDLRHIPYIGVFRRVQVGQIDEEAGGLSEEEINDIYKRGMRSAGTLGWGPNDYGTANGPREAVVLDLWWYDWMEISYKATDKAGKPTDYRIIPDSKLLPDEYAKGKSRRVPKKVKKVCGASWVVGTDVFYNLGPMPYQPCVAPSDPVLPIVVSMQSENGFAPESMGRNAEVPLNNIQLSHMRIQNISSMNGPNGLGYYEELLAEVAADEGTTADNIMRKFRASGLLKMHISDQFLQRADAAPLVPIAANDQSLPLATEFQTFAHWLQVLKLNMGLSDASFGGVEERKGKAVVEAELAQSEQGFWTLTSAMTRLGRDVSRVMVAFATAACFDDRMQQTWRDMVGDEVVDTVRGLAKEAYAGSKNAAVLESVGIDVLPYPDPMLMNSLNMMVQNGVTGNSPIMTMHEALRVQRLLSSGRVNKAVSLLRRYEKQRQQQAEKSQAAMAEQQMMMQQQAMQMQQQSKQMDSQMKAEADAMKINLGYEKDAKLSAQEHEQGVQMLTLEESLRLRAEQMLEARRAQEERTTNRQQAGLDIMVNRSKPEPRVGGN